MITQLFQPAHDLSRTVLIIKIKYTENIFNNKFFTMFT